MNLKVQKKQKSRDAIIASASALMRSQGIRASSVMDVMRGAGLTVGGFYGHFDSKEALFAATIHETASAKWNRLLETTTGPTPAARALSVLKRYLSATHRDDPMNGCILPSVAPDVSLEGGVCRDAIEAELSGFASAYGALLEGDAKPREAALGLIALMYGALSLSRAVAGTPLSDEILRAARALGRRMLEPDAGA